MIPYRWINIAVMVGFLLAGLSPAKAIENPPAELILNNRTWVLHATGVRSKNLMDAYQCSLYLDKENQPTESFHKLNSPITIHIRILTSLLPDKIPGEWRETIEPEVTGQAFDRFRKNYLTLDEEDILDFVYIPGEGTHIFLNGELKFRDPGKGLMQSLLEQWMGPNPVSEDLKRALTSRNRG